MNLLPITCTLLAGATWLTATSSGPSETESDRGERTVSFSRDVQPVLSSKCFTCHGPDEETREADLRLDQEQGLFEDRGGYFAIAPGLSAESEVYLRASDPDDPMPPEGEGEPLTPDELETLRAWIDQGAAWEDHWSFVAPRRPALPTGAATDSSPIDEFVQARLRENGLQPAPLETPARLLRRVSFDLTGLPPTLEELDAFLADPSPEAYAAAVDRLLASPRYGEHMARAWLDAARYGDTHGLHLDNERNMWPYRDWVIAAFNANMPFDRFTIEQLAGDLLPEPTRDQRIATGFNRCNPTTAEGGLIAEEYLVKYALDRVDTTSTVWMGLSVACAQCHDHKYDPISQKDFFRFFAFFNNVAEEASDGNALVAPPIVSVPSPEQERELDRLDQEMARVEEELAAPLPEVDAAQEEWEQSHTAKVSERWQEVEVLALSSRDGATLAGLPDGSILASGSNPDKDVHELLLVSPLAGITAVMLETLPDESLPQGGTGRAPNSNFVLTEIEAEAAQPGGSFQPIRWSAAVSDYSQSGYPIRAAIDGNTETGWAVDGKTNARRVFLTPQEPIGSPGTLLRLRLGFESRFQQHAIGRYRIRVTSDPDMAAAQLGPWYLHGPHSAESFDAAYDHDFGPEAGGVPEDSWQERSDWTDGQVIDLSALEPEGVDRSAVYARREIVAPTARTLTIGLGSDDGVRLWHNGQLVHDNPTRRPPALDQDTVRLELVAGVNTVLIKVVNDAGGFGFAFRRLEEALAGLSTAGHGILAKPIELRSEEDLAFLRNEYRQSNSPIWRSLADERDRLQTEREALVAQVPRTMVMEERAERRATYVLERGQYDRPTEPVQADVPACLPPLATTDPEAESGNDRLDLANWLVAPGHPLTARVTVNRFWQRLFGQGLVRTSEDFGAQGERPSHPALLDWLAVDFVENGWDVKAFLRQLVLSHTYRQSARHTGPGMHLDPENRLLWRGPRFRLEAESLRDAALYVSGLLIERIGGPSVRPYQPAGLWNAVAYTSSNTARFERDAGDALYRRSLYTFWKRTAPPPSMQIFDAPSREACTVRRPRTNTPLQALVTLNDVQFVEAARRLGARLFEAEADDDAGRIEAGFRMVTARRPSSAELSLLLGLLEDERRAFAADPSAAQALLSVGESPGPEAEWGEIAAWTQIASVLLNLDEALTKG